MAYDRRFTAEFMQQLAERGSPMYPQTHWWTALRRADELAPCNEPAPLAFKDRLVNDERVWKSGVPQPRVQEGRRWWAYSVMRACDAFWARRYGCY
jgi:hypothetical protein